MKTTIFGFMKGHMKQIVEILAEFGTTFNALEFIGKFMVRFKYEYDDYLNSYTGNKPMKVNNLIARFLSASETALKITKARRVPSLNANGNMSMVQEWNGVPDC